MKTYILSFLLCLFAAPTIWAQGIVRGTVTEAATGFEVIGARVKVNEQQGVGAATDFDGKFSIEGLEPGTYSLTFSYLGLAKQTITEVEVKDGEVTILNVQMQEESTDIINVVITARALANTEGSMVSKQKNSAIVLDGISAAQFKKSGDNDAASAVARVPGVTVEGGKYVYVRGLGDRYSKTLLNSAEVPSLDPNRNTVQMDLFPTNLLDNVVVYKTFSPNLPASFTGGCVDIGTKAFPDALTVNASFSLGYNTLSTFNSNFLTHEGGATDFIGVDDGTRALPTPSTSAGFIRSEGALTVDNVDEVATNTKAFSNNFSFEEVAPLPNKSASFSVGNQTKLAGKKLGYIVGLTYNDSYNYYEDGQSGRYKLLTNINQTSGLDEQIEFTDRRSTYNSIWGAMGTLNYKLSDNDRISLLVMHNQSGEKGTRYQEGRRSADDLTRRQVTRAQTFEQRGLSTAQLSGEHVFEKANKLKFEWAASGARATQEQPDWRFFTYEYTVDGADTIDYAVRPANGQLPSRYWRSMEQYNVDMKGDFTLPFENLEWLENIKFGGGYLIKDRGFTENQFRYASRNQNYGNNVNDYFGNVIDRKGDGSIANDGVYIFEFYEPENSYNAQEYISSGYLMGDFPLLKQSNGKAKLRLITGLRLESTKVGLNSAASDASELDLTYTDILPALNISYTLKEDDNTNEKMAVRGAYTRTLARPTFRELAPFTSFSFIGDYLFQGNPNLERTLVDNFDLRWEWYPGGVAEIISVSAFYKNFQNPIERVAKVKASEQLDESTLENVESAFLLGGELEVRKNLTFISEQLKNFYIAANFSYIYSRTDINDAEYQSIKVNVPFAEASRPMFGQSPYVINGLLSYNNKELGLLANLSYNVSGRRLSIVLRNGTPNIYELPRNVLDFNITKTLGERFKIRLSVGNILGAKMQFAHFFENETTVTTPELYYYQNNPIGRTVAVKLYYNFDASNE